MNRLLQILLFVLFTSSFAISKIIPKEPIKIKPNEKEINVKTEPVSNKET